MWGGSGAHRRGGCGGRCAAATEAAGFPGCGHRRFLHAHHIVHWSAGGKTSFTNLILLCGRHHRLVHEGGDRVETLSDHVFVFFDPRGRVVPEVGPGSAAGGPSLAERNGAAGVTVGPETCRSLGEGEAYSLDLTIEALIGAAARAERAERSERPAA